MTGWAILAGVAVLAVLAAGGVGVAWYAWRRFVGAAAAVGWMLR